MGVSASRALQYNNTTVWDNNVKVDEFEAQQADAATAAKAAAATGRTGGEYVVSVAVRSISI
jgi:hypothetical protein